MGIHQNVGLLDTFMNLITSLGTMKDPTTAGMFVYREIQRNVLENMYRSDWLSRKIVDAVAEDMTREWRSWHADQKQIECIEALERKFKLQEKLKLAIQRARLYGGGAIVMGVEQGNTWDELKVEDVGKDDLKFLVVVNRWELNAGPRIYDVTSPWYTKPSYYTVATPMYGLNKQDFELATPSPLLGWIQGMFQRSRPQSMDPTGGDVAKMVTPVSGMVKVHPSRVVELSGNPLPDWRLAPMGGGWGDSVLQTCEDAIKDVMSVISGIAAMAADMKVDVVKIPGMSEQMSTQKYKDDLLTRFSLSNQAKSMVNTLLIDKEEDWSRIQTRFAGQDDVIREFLVVVSGASDIPISRLIGQSPKGGLGGASGGAGESDLRNYYDRVKVKLNTEITPALELLDQVLIRSALGKYDPDIRPEWNPLWQLEPKEKADIAKTKAETMQVEITTGLVNEDALREARVNQLIEDGDLPGIESAIEDHGAEPEIEESRLWSPGIDPTTGLALTGAAKVPPGGGNGGAAPGPAAPNPAPQTPNPNKQSQQNPNAKVKDADLNDATPRTLYVRRDVTNGKQIVAWAKAAGFTTTLAAKDMHVTIMFSRTPLDWMKTGSSWSGSKLVVQAGGPRMIERYGDAVCLLFSCDDLKWRHRSIKNVEGCTYDFEDYQPHITISWDVPPTLDLNAITPYQGVIRLGPEIYEEVNTNFRETINEE